MEGKHEAADVVLDIQDLWVEYKTDTGIVQALNAWTGGRNGSR